MHEGDRASGDREGRRTVALVLVGAFAGLVAVGSLALVQRESADGNSAVETVAALPPLEPAQIYPSLAEPAPRRIRSYRRLFARGHSLETAAAPACPRYERVRRVWWRRGESIRRSSRGAEASKAAAARYYAGVVWVSQDEAGDFREAIARISRSRMSVATHGAVKRGFHVGVFTRDALAHCGLGEDYARTVRGLSRLDQRIAGIVALARFNGSGTENQNAQ